MLARAVVPILVLCLAGATARADDPKPKADTLGLSVPRGSKVIDDQLWQSRRSFRKTVRFYQRLFERKGIDVEAVPVYRYRGVVVARFLAKKDNSPWMAVQVFRRRGDTRIAIVPAPADD